MSEGSRIKKCLLVFALFCSFLPLQGCSSKEETPADIITQKKSEDGRTQITVLVKYAFTINQFEKIVEEKFPDIDLVQVGNYTANTALAKEFEERLEHDDLTDIVMTWPLDVGSTYWEDRLIDMSGMNFTGKYNASMLKSIENDGKIYFIPGPADIRGIVYNKTLFEENGWTVPNSYEEFITLCKQIQATGMRSLMLSIGNAEVLDTAFVGYNYAQSYSKPADTDWIYQYNENKTGNFLDHFGSALATFQELIDAGILQKGDLDLHYQDTQLALFTRKAAMTEDSLLLTKRAKQVTNSDDEYALMPFFNKGEESDWTRIYMTCYIGLNKHLQESQNKDKYDKVLKLLEYISTPEGQTALSADSGGMYSSLKDVQPPTVSALESLNASLTQGRYAQFPTLKNAQDALRAGLAGMVEGSMDASAVGALVDQANSVSTAQEEEEVLGKATKDFTMIETGNYVTDIMKKQCDSDIALFMDNGKDGLYNGKGISAKFYEGEITQEDIKRVFPDLQHGEKGELWKVEMSGEDILHTLEYSIEVDNTNGWFYYFSGLNVSFDPTAELGSRVSEITLSDGSKLDLKKTYTVAVMEDTVSEDLIQHCDNTGILIQELLADSIKEAKTISPSEDGRFTIVQ